MKTTDREKNDLIESYLPIIAQIGRTFRLSFGQDDYDDARACAMLAVSKAIDRFDEHVAATIDTYVSTAIMNAFRHYAKSRNRKQRTFERQCIPISHMSDKGEAEREWSGGGMGGAAEGGGRGGGGGCSSDHCTSPDDFDMKIWRERVVAEIRSPRGRRVITMRLEGASYSEIGRRLGVSRQRAHQIYTDATDEIRKAMGVGEEG